MALPAGLVTFLFTDIEGSTALLERLGEQRYARLLETHDDLLRSAIERHGGVVVKSLGDGLFAAFPETRAGVVAATAAMDAIREHRWPDAAEPRVRMGLHTAPAQPVLGDYRALGVHVAARIAAAAAGGEILASGETAQTSSPPIADGWSWHPAGEFVLHGVERPVPLLHLVREGQPVTPPRALRAERHNLPAIRSSFVGRKEELDTLAALVDRHRLVSVLGPGGVGKTRLAFEVARRAAGSSVGGVRAVLLADLPPGSDVTERVALALGASGRAPTLSESIADWARNNEALVVLDNCEQVVESVARVVDHLLVESSRVTVLVTSRQPLRVADEVTWRLPAMPTDDADEESDAVALLRERAAAARPELSLDPALARELCRDLDGLPLAIEIAAARLLHMSPEQLRRSLGDRMAVLRSSRRDVPERQRTLDALLRWSYDLLDPGERDVLARVAIFSSPFDLDAATAVAASTGTEVVDALGGLVDHSLLQLVGGPETRYRMLMTVRDFARERLREQERLAATADRHAQWIITRLKPLADRVALQREDYLDARRTFDELYDDAIAALEHLDATADDRSFAELTCALFDYWYARGLVATARRWFARALRSEDPRVLSRAGSLDQAVGADGDAVLGRLLSACDRAREVGDGRVLAECLARAGAKAVEITDGASGEEQLREALEIPEARDIDRAAARNGLAMLANRRGDIEGSLREYDLALEACEHLPIGRALLQQNLAEILVEEHGDLDRAEALVLDALSVLEERDPTLADFGHEVLHRVALARGDRETARYWLDRALESLERLEQPDPRDVERMRELRGKL